jgi:hypothetical protein
MPPAVSRRPILIRFPAIDLAFPYVAVSAYLRMVRI